jgi:hypothetical protein
MISERGRRITYIEGILELRRQEEKRLSGGEEAIKHHQLEALQPRDCGSG